MTPQEAEAFQEQQAARATARAKWGDSQAAIEDGDLAHFSGDEIKQLINSGRIPGIGADKRLRRR